MVTLLILTWLIVLSRWFVTYMYEKDVGFRNESCQRVELANLLFQSVDMRR